MRNLKRKPVPVKPLSESERIGWQVLAATIQHHRDVYGFHPTRSNPATYTKG